MDLRDTSLMRNCPSITIAGLSGDGGKTLVALGLTAGWVKKGLRIAPFKKGPDYIDAAWLSLAAGAPCRNLDTFLMADAAIHRTWDYCCQRSDVAVIEGNRGLYDGMDVHGKHSTAELAKRVNSPVLLVVDATKTTRTLAAMVLGMREFDSELTFAGVVLNKVGGSRHIAVARQAIEDYTGIPVVGAIPKFKDGDKLLPGRHLGLVTVDEHPKAHSAIETARELVADSVDINTLLITSTQSTGAVLACILPFADIDRIPEPPEISQDRTIAPRVATPAPAPLNLRTDPGASTPGPTRVGVIRDSAFSFYYPENLEALQRGGAEIVTINSLRDGSLPAKLDALYIGGGFPETHLKRLSENKPFLQSLNRAAQEGLPIYAECGGLMLLCDTVEFEGERQGMAGILPYRCEWSKKPVGHGYMHGVVDTINPFYPIRTRIRGHEFHHSKVVPLNDGDMATAVNLGRGTGVGDNRDGLIIHNVLALYAHVHAAGLPEWAEGILSAARRYRKLRRIEQEKRETEKNE